LFKTSAFKLSMVQNKKRKKKRSSLLNKFKRADQFKKLPIDQTLYNPGDCLLNSSTLSKSEQFRSGQDENSRYWEMSSFQETIMKEVFLLKNKYEVFLHSCFLRYGSKPLTSTTGMHLHHIIPVFELKNAFNQSQDAEQRSFLQNLTQLSWNLVFLTVKDHATAHKLRYEVYCTIQDKKASCLLGLTKEIKISPLTKLYFSGRSVRTYNLKSFKNKTKLKKPRQTSKPVEFDDDTLVGNRVENPNRVTYRKNFKGKKNYRRYRRKNCYEEDSNREPSYRSKNYTPRPNKRRYRKKRR